VADNIQQSIQQVLAAFAKSLDEAAKKHFTAFAAARTDTGERKGRGGDSNRLLPGESGIPLRREFDKSIKQLSFILDRASKNVFQKSYEDINSALEITRGFFTRTGRFKKIFDRLLEDADAYAEQQSGMYRDIADSTMKYIRGSGTDMRKIKGTIDALDNYNKKLHEYVKDNTLSKEKAKELKLLREQLKQREISIDILADADEETRKIVDKLEQGFATLTDKEFKDYSEGLQGLSSATKKAADVIINLSGSVSENFLRMQENISSRMSYVLKGSAVALGYGFSQMYNDALFRYQASINEDMKGRAITLGMSHRELQEVTLDYRDVLRRMAAETDKGIYSIDLNAVQDIGKTFGMIGEEGLRFGLTMRESAQLLGMGKDFDSEKMEVFFSDAAKTLNMNVQEFSNYFNEMSKDSNFVSFINNLRVTGDNITKVLGAEVTKRIQMNKLLGLSNEFLQRRISLEQSKKWQTVTERYRSRIGTNILISDLEKQLDMELTQAQKVLLEKYAFDATLLTSAQRKDVQGPLYAVLMAPAVMIQEMQEKLERGEISDAEYSSFANNVALIKHRLLSFGQMTDLMWDPETSEKMVAAARNFGLKPIEIMQAVSKDMDKLPPDLKKQFETIMGIPEAAMGKGPKELTGLDGLIFNDPTITFVGELTEKVTGVVSSGIVKAFLGALGGVANLSFQMAMMKMMHNFLIGTPKIMEGVMKAALTPLTYPVGIVVNSLRLFNTAVLQSEISLRSLGSFKGILGGVSAIAFGAAIGTAAGRTLYHYNKNKKGFIDAVDFFMGDEDVTFKPFSGIKRIEGKQKPGIDRYTGAPMTELEDRRRQLVSRRLEELGSGLAGKEMSFEKVTDTQKQLRLLITASNKLEKAMQNPEGDKEDSQIELLKKTVDGIMKLLEIDEKRWTKEKKKFAAEEQNVGRYTGSVAAAQGRREALTEEMNALNTA
jgi:hypothetical protein